MAWTDAFLTTAFFALCAGAILALGRWQAKRDELALRHDAHAAWLDGYQYGRTVADDEGARVLPVPPYDWRWVEEWDECKSHHPASKWLEEHARGRFDV